MLVAGDRGAGIGRGWVCRFDAHALLLVSPRVVIRLPPRVVYAEARVQNEAFRAASKFDSGYDIHNPCLSFDLPTFRHLSPRMVAEAAPGARLPPNKRSNSPFGKGLLCRYPCDSSQPSFIR